MRNILSTKEMVATNAAAMARCKDGGQSNTPAETPPARRDTPPVTDHGSSNLLPLLGSASLPRGGRKSLFRS